MKPHPRHRSFLRLGISCSVALAIVVVALYWSQPIKDWVQLRSYTPPAEITTLADQTTMTNQARRLFYLNRPAILDRTEFNKQCPSAAEKTIILGCYHSVQRGIYLFAVTDSQLYGVEQVTAAHEMLHAAYDRLSKGQKQSVDAMLMDYYNNDLHDDRIRGVLQAYKKSEPNDVVNEMHSIFGTEVAQLPHDLSTYYGQYFTDRSAVVAFADTYRQAFTDRERKIAIYDVQLAALEQDITRNEARLNEQAGVLRADRASVEVSGSQSRVDAYNQRVADYNTLLQHTNSLVDQYNAIVADRNAIALEEKRLQQSLNSNIAPE